MRATAVVGGVLLALALVAGLITLVIAADAECMAVRSVLICRDR